MKKIKIVKFYVDDDQNYGFDDYSWTNSQLYLDLDGCTSWEEISDEEYTNLKEIFKTYQQYTRDKKLSCVQYAIIEPPITSDQCKTELAEYVKMWQVEADKKKEKEELRKTKTARASATRAANKEKKDRAEFEKLRKKFENTGRKYGRGDDPDE